MKVGVQGRHHELVPPLCLRELFTLAKSQSQSWEVGHFSSQVSSGPAFLSDGNSRRHVIDEMSLGLAMILRSRKNQNGAK